MKKVSEIVFCAIIGIAVMFSIIKFNRQGEISTSENRSIAPKPTHFIDFQDWDNFFNDRFGGREQLIDLANNIDYNILHKVIKNNEAFLGRNGWFYYIGENNLSDFYKTNLLDTSELRQFKSSIQETTQWCDDNGIKYLFVICPNKHNVYPEYHILKRPDGITRTHQILSVLKEANIDCLFSLKYLLERKKDNIPLYYETDTHWNDLGAYYAFEEIKQSVEKLFPQKKIPNIDYDGNIMYSDTIGDILPMLRVKTALCTQISLKPKNSDFTDYFVYIKNEGRGGIITQGKSDSLPTAVIFHDSFMSALVPYLSTLFSHAEYNWRCMTEEDKQNLLENKPDLIIFESVERHSPYLFMIMKE